ncbi:23S rRNA (adenine(2030)-N(6))-methyltransferase RlmJ [Wenzhouxiangella sp. XN79A]|uniref:23S rRNA (adenine(2030)-N(6))-methyltransferase RlmJ n=1 Tax=Wenzhouxiangella sp. XN79A TaxID=2724193 RepID=UPI00144AEB3B|nr:23S rRNA (adenine(2030)-N(6))-methyltransferase RlmJ [Wenzhouxiangella sp. XN79A]NKI34893.1 23S rRNA (adenine(2030)-N(6))-methyltransferase RlmJ [Wenzhouxiangella sp. XN79A]
MLSYRHGFHAGNPADVFKHAVLLALVEAMQRKPKGIRFVDTHAGPADYDLGHEFATKNREFERGIGAIWRDPPAALADYVDAVRRHNPEERLARYPGSPELLRDRLRGQDELVLCELHPTEQRALNERFTRDRHVSIVTGDGYATLASLPAPKTGRGLTLIDPPFELKSELDDLADALSAALRQFGHGVYAIWYPVIEGKATTPDALPDILGLDDESWLDLRIRFTEAERLGRMTGCGMAIVNPPWSARDALARITALWPAEAGSAA